jgi:protease-4
MESQFQQIVTGIAEARKLTPEKVQTLVNQGPFSAKRALEAKLIDGLLYRDEMETKVKEKGRRPVTNAAEEKTAEELKVLDLLTYIKRTDGLYETGDTIALIYGVGAVERGKEQFNPLSGGSTMGSETVSAAFRAAVEDKDVKAILFRVDSPGGSYIASDTIWRETLRAKQAGKPVIVSMGNLAGSGGYFVAMAADKIVAQPGTITGSIGVFAGKMVTAGFWDKVGLAWDEVHTSDNATMWSSTQDYTPAQWAQLQETLDHIYDDFTTKAAEGRRLPKEKILEIAKGRVWTGEDAKVLGLVDELGGFPTALRLAKEAAGIAADAPIQLRMFPHRRKSLREIIVERILEGGDTNGDATVVALTRVLDLMRPLVHLAQTVGLGQTPGVLTMPEPTSTR